MKRSHRSKRKHTKGGSPHLVAENKLKLEAAATWPVFDCLISASWRDTMNLTEILISKEPPFGGVVSCVFLLDLGCLGPKQAFVTEFRTKAEYEREFRSMMKSRISMIDADYSLAAKIIQKSMEYSTQLGFTLPPGVQRTLSALGSLDVAMECHVDVPLGAEDGMPRYIAGPEDDTDHVIGILVAKCGHGNFHFTIPQSPIPPGFFD